MESRGQELRMHSGDQTEATVPHPLLSFTPLGPSTVLCALQVIQAAAQVNKEAHLYLKPCRHPPKREMKLWPEAFSPPALETHCALQQGPLTSPSLTYSPQQHAITWSHGTWVWVPPRSLASWMTRARSSNLSESAPHFSSFLF